MALPRWECPRLFSGRTAVILASGPSLTQGDIETVRSAHAAGGIGVIAVNSTFRRAPWADVLYGGDAAWWNATPDALGFAGLKIACSQVGSEPWPDGVRKFWHRRNEGIETDRRYIGTGTNSGHQALNAAVHLGAAKIILLGYDFSIEHGSHHHGAHPGPLKNPDPVSVARWLRLIETTAAPLRDMGVDVVNCSRRTAIMCFRRGDLAAELAQA